MTNDDLESIRLRAAAQRYLNAKTAQLAAEAPEHAVIAAIDAIIFPLLTDIEALLSEVDVLMSERTASRQLLLSFIGSLTLADHLGDVGNDITEVLEQAGVEIEWDELADLGAALGKMGVRTLYDTPLGEDEDEEPES